METSKSVLDFNSQSYKSGFTPQEITNLELENTSIASLDTERAFLGLLGLDSSGSMNQDNRVSTMRLCLGTYVKAMEGSKKADEILLAKGVFSSNIDISGYKPIAEFDTSYSAGGITLLIDFICAAAPKLLNYKKMLESQGMIVDAAFAMFSDGEDRGSINSETTAANWITQLRDNEIETIFVEFGPEANGLATKLGFAKIITAGASESELRAAFNQLSESMKDASEKVGDNFAI